MAFRISGQDGKFLILFKNGLKNANRITVAAASPRVIASVPPNAAYFIEKMHKKEVREYAKISFIKDSAA